MQQNFLISANTSRISTFLILSRPCRAAFHRRSGRLQLLFHIRRRPITLAAAAAAVPCKGASRVLQAPARRIRILHRPKSKKRRRTMSTSDDAADDHRRNGNCCVCRYCSLSISGFDFLDEKPSFALWTQTCTKFCKYSFSQKNK